MKILLSNDDSVHADGIKVLAKFLSKIADVTIVAPLEEKSTTGHSLTLHKPLRLIQMEKKTFAVNGSPADCIHLGLSEVFKGKCPDLVVSGINRGANLGQDVFYSGTVSAAREAAIMGIPALAVSLDVAFNSRPKESDLHYETSAEYAVKVIKEFYLNKNKIKIPTRTLLNLNTPDLPFKKVKGLRFAPQGFRHYGGSILKRVDHRGKEYFWVGGKYHGYEKREGSDCYVVGEGYASLTPLSLDTTDHAFLNVLNDLNEVTPKGRQTKTTRKSWSSL